MVDRKGGWLIRKVVDWLVDKKREWLMIWLLEKSG